MSAGWWVNISLGIAFIRMWWLWRAAIGKLLKLAQETDNSHLWSMVIERELTRSHQLATTVYEGQFSLNRDYLRVLEDREKMRGEVAARTHDLWMLEEKCKQQENQIEKLSGSVSARSRSIFKSN